MKGKCDLARCGHVTWRLPSLSISRKHATQLSTLTLNFILILLKLINKKFNIILSIIDKFIKRVTFVSN